MYWNSYEPLTSDLLNEHKFPYHSRINRKISCERLMHQSTKLECIYVFSFMSRGITTLQQSSRFPYVVPSASFVSVTLCVEVRTKQNLI